MEKPKDAVFGYLAPLLGDQALNVGWRLVLELASLGLGVNLVMAIDLSTAPVVPDFFAGISNSSSAWEVGQEFVQYKVALPLPITSACGLFTGTKVNLLQGPIPQRDVLRDAYFIASVSRLLGEQIEQCRRRAESQLVVWNALDLGAGRPL